MVTSREQQLVVAGKPPPEPPPDLTAAEAAIWRDIVGAVRPDWFGTETQPLLVELCRHHVYARELAAEIAAVKDWLGMMAPRSAGEPPLTKEVKERKAELFNLYRAHGFQSERIGNLATKLRLTNQARYQPKANKTPDTPRMPAPWQLGDRADDESDTATQQ